MSLHEATVLSQTLSKRDDGLKLGAVHYHATGDPETVEKLAGTFDIILNTASGRLDLEQINEAYDRVLSSDVRYRFVLGTATLD